MIGGDPNPLFIPKLYYNFAKKINSNSIREHILVGRNNALLYVASGSNFGHFTHLFLNFKNVIRLKKIRTIFFFIFFLQQ